MKICTAEPRLTKFAPSPFPSPVYVTRPVLPDIGAYAARLADIWESRWLSNYGKQHAELTESLKSHLGSNNLSLLSNGTLALLLLLKALDLKGDVITSPFTFPATVQAINWAGCKVKFVDINESLTIDPSQVSQAIDQNTCAILGVHVYGIPCEVERLEEIAATHRLKLLFDGAHAFGTTINGSSISNFGDGTIYSFHPTKLFHSAEGGAVVCKDSEVLARVNLLKNFGIQDEENVVCAGLNSKMNELQAAMGLEVLKVVGQERAKRDAIRLTYEQAFSNMRGVRMLVVPENVSHSLQYAVILIDEAVSAISRDAMYTKLKGYNVFARKYFHPLCSEFKWLSTTPGWHPDLSRAQQVSRQCLALPFYGDLGVDGAQKVAEVIGFLID